MTDVSARNGNNVRNVTIWTVLGEGKWKSDDDLFTPIKSVGLFFIF